MAGKPRGPVPKRTDQRRRRNVDEGGPVTKVTVTAPTPIAQHPDELWHPIAAEWFKSLSESGQSHFYEASDWATARYVAEAMSRNLNSGERFSAVLFAAVMSGMTELLTTEGARRRARVELEREEPSAPPSVAIMEKYRRAANKGS